MNTTAALRTTVRAGVVAAVAALTLGLAGNAFAAADSAVATVDTRPAATSLHIDGAFAGVLDDAEVTCDRATLASWSWAATGTVDGTPVLIAFGATGTYRGAGSYATTGSTEAAGGPVTLVVGGGGDEVEMVSDAATVGSFTVDDGERSGSVDTTLEDLPHGGSVRISGSWSCP